MSDGKVDVSLSGMVPEHEILSKAEEGKVLALFGIKREMLPKLKVTDPQAKRIGAKVGDVVKITRKDTCVNVAYRLVIKSEK